MMKPSTQKNPGNREKRLPPKQRYRKLKNLTDQQRIKMLKEATGPEDIRAAIAGLTPTELAEMGIV